MIKTAKILINLTAGVILFTNFAYASNNWSSGQFSSGDNWEACFTGQKKPVPRGDCTELAVNEINAAKNTIDVQAYSFTSKPILRALAAAEARGVNVQVLLDKSDATARYNVTGFLQSNNIPFLIDFKPSIAHNKVIIIDGATVITGSFNFTNAAQYNNAENLLVIHDLDLAKQYQQNFVYRQSQSVTLSQYQSQKGYDKNSYDYEDGSE